MARTYAVSFSNIAGYKGLPVVFIGLAIPSLEEQNIKCFKTKDELLPDPLAYPEFDLSILEQEIAKYKHAAFTIKVSCIKKPKLKSDGDAANFIIKSAESIISNDISSFSEGVQIAYVHAPLRQDGQQLVLQETIGNKKYSFKYPLLFQNKGNYSQLLQVARLFAVYEYLKKRRLLSSRAYFYLNNSGRNLTQLLSIHWNNPNVRTYSNSFIGFPELIMKSQNQESSIITLSPGCQLDFFPIVHACQGIGDYFEVERCLGTSLKKPFGILTKGEKCPKCRKRSAFSDCLLKKPKCDGSLIECKDNSFAGNVCNGKFSIYVSIFGDKIKVGRAIFSRTICRLVEQSAYDALVFYQINSLNLSSVIETRVTKYLQSKLSKLKPFGIRTVTKSIEQTERLAQVTDLIRKGKVSEELTSEKLRREHIYDTIEQLLRRFVTPENYPFNSLECNRISFSQNWIIENIPIDNLDVIPKPQFQRISGKVSGVVGSFVFIENKVHDFDNLIGYVMECQQPE